ncbi:MAG: pimeloyl-ACP methyl ester esterase BioH [Rhodanobacteraceae bacterium]
MSDLYIHTEGRGDTPLVLLHGWAMHGGVFAPLIEALRDRCTLHVVDLPGHGRSRDCETSLQPEDCARAIAARVPPAVWLGWSMGGLVALQAALDFPERVHALAMLCASPRFVRGEDWNCAVSPEILQDFARDLETDYAGTLERFLALEALGSDCAQADLRKLRADTFNEHPPRVRALIEGLAVLEHTDLRARVHELRVPSAWIAGRRDRLVPWRAMQWAADQCDGAFTCVTGGGHAPFIGHTDEVVAAIEPLLRSAAT